MAYNETLAARVREALGRRKGVTERKMFGGLAFMLRGNMCCGVTNDDLMLRLGERGATAAMREPHVRAMDFTGKPLKSMVFVGPRGSRADADLQRWVTRAVQFTRTLAAK